MFWGSLTEGQGLVISAVVGPLVGILATVISGKVGPRIRRRVNGEGWRDPTVAQNKGWMDYATELRNRMSELESRDSIRVASLAALEEENISLRRRIVTLEAETANCLQQNLLLRRRINHLNRLVAKTGKTVH